MGDSAMGEQLGPLPEGWQLIPLVRVIENHRGGVWGNITERGKGVPVLRSTNMRGGKFDFSDVATCVISPEIIQTLKLRFGDIIVTKSSGSPHLVGLPVIFDFNPDGRDYLFSNFTLRLRPDQTKINPFFLWNYLSSEKAASDRRSMAQDTTGLRNLKTNEYLAQLIPLPPLPEQERIVARLEAILAQVRAARQALVKTPATLRALRRSLLAAAVSGHLTEEWRELHPAYARPITVSLRDTNPDIRYGSSAKSLKSGMIPVLRMGNIQDGKIDWGDLVFTSSVDEIRKYQLRPGDVLFNRTNSPELVGKTAVFKGDRPAIFAGYLIRVRCNEKLLPDYLNYCLNSPAGRDYCWWVKSDGVSQSNINAQKLADFRFLLPSVEEQHEIIQRVERLFEYIYQVENQLKNVNQKLNSLEQAALGRAFRGELL